MLSEKVIDENSSEFEDVCLVQEALKEHGYNFSFMRCYNLWERYSEYMCIGSWLEIPATSEGVVAVLRRFIE